MNKKWLNIGIAVLAAVAVLVLGLGTGIALAKGKEIQTLNAPTVAYDPEYSTCPNCQGFQNGGCLNGGNCGGNCNGQGGCQGGGNCAQGGGCGGGWTTGSNNVPACHGGRVAVSASNQPRCGGCGR